MRRVWLVAPVDFSGAGVADEIRMRRSRWARARRFAGRWGLCWVGVGGACVAVRPSQGKV